MGNTIAAHATSKKLQHRMQAFMTFEYRSWRQVMGLAPAGDFDGDASPPTTDLDYDKAENAIGFNYSGLSGWEREYVYAVCRWMAIKVGERKQVVDGKTFAQPVAYIAYDDDREFPVDNNFDELGIKTGSSDPRFSAYPEAFFDLSEEDEEAYRKEIASLAESKDDESRAKKVMIRDRYTKCTVEEHVAIIRRELLKLTERWSLL